MSYQGPNAQVTQVFETTPPAVAIEQLPSVAIGSAYDVYAKEKLGVAIGVLATVSYPWTVDGSNPVIFDTSFGTRLYNRYPALVYARDTKLGDFEISATKSSSGVSVAANATYTYSEVTSGNAYMPFIAVTSGTMTIDADNAVITAANGRFVSAGIKAGMEVVVLDTTYKLVGSVAQVTETTITLAEPYGSTITAMTAIYVGAGAFVDTATFAAGTFKTTPAYIYDPDNTNASVNLGDVVAVSSLALASDITSASVDQKVGSNMIRIFTGTATSGNVSGYTATSLTSYYSAGTTASTASFKCVISSYSLKRFVGFTPKYDTSATTTAVYLSSKSGATATLAGTVTSPQTRTFNEGDYIIFDEEATKVYEVITVVTAGSVYVLDQSITATAGATAYLKAYAGSSVDCIRHDVVADYRAARIDVVGTVFKSSDNTLVNGASSIYGDVSVYNDLAMQIAIIQGTNGGRVMYAVSVDPTESALAQYQAALEALKFYDVYSHCLGTDDAGVNAVMPAYVDEQSDPYEAHERVAILAYNEEDVYTLGTDSATGVSAGTVTITGHINLIGIGLSIGDKVKYTVTSTGVDHESTVIAMPTASTVLTDESATLGAGTARFLAGTKSKQASRIEALGAGNRRIKIVWPGTFKGDVAATGNIPAATAIDLPSYFISALRCGMDGGQKVSQSCTRLTTSIPGISNIQLGTNSYFRKAELDIIGGGGIDIMVQENPISNTIFSRHDLTSDMSAVEYREWSITKQADLAAKTLRGSVDPYIGKYNITPQLLKFITMVCNAVSTSLVKNSVVAQLQILEVKRDPDIADKINILVKATVFIAGNYYDITMVVVSR